MPTIPLTRGLRARVDWADYKELSRYSWHASPKDHGGLYAARRKQKGEPGVYMHRQILGLDKGDPRQVDHKNHDPLDNRRSNLRIVTNRQNAENRRHQSRYGVGVYRTRCGRYRLEVVVDGKTIKKNFETPEAAQKGRKEILDRIGEEPLRGR